MVGSWASFIVTVIPTVTFSALASVLVGNCGWFLGMCYSSFIIIVITAVMFSALVSLVDNWGWFMSMLPAIFHCYCHNGDFLSSGLGASRQLLVPGHDAVHLSLLFTMVSIFHCS